MIIIYLLLFLRLIRFQMDLLTYMSLMGLKVGSQSCLDIRVKGGTGVFLRAVKLAFIRLDMFLLMVTLSLGGSAWPVMKKSCLPAELIDEKGSECETSSHWWRKRKREQLGLGVCWFSSIFSPIHTDLIHTTSVLLFRCFLLFDAKITKFREEMSEIVYMRIQYYTPLPDFPLLCPLFLLFNKNVDK